MTALTAAILWPIVACDASPSPPESIVLIVIDTLRWDHLSCYGSEVSTPNIHALAARGEVDSTATASFHQTSI